MKAHAINRRIAGHILSLAGLVFLISLAYLNTLNASWHMDDRPNILDNSGLHITNLKPESLIRTFYTSPQQRGAIGKKLYRPIPCLTFALNWYLGQDQVFGYHLVNLIIHSLTALLLYFTINQLLNTSNLAEKNSPHRALIAFLAATLWALNPIQTQAVTYIVQRMASMAAMFYVLSILFYLRFRLANHAAGRVSCLLGSVFGFLLALGSKENAVSLPVALFLIEVVFLQDLRSNIIRRRILFITGAALLILICLAAYIYYAADSIGIFHFYQKRSFAMWQRLLTEFRIVVFYISQLFYPAPYRLSIDHHVTLSTSLLEPWNTLPSILLVFVAIGFGFSQIGKRPLVAFAILFFFLNHVVESTIIPIELIFEHRNYLPSLFVFLPVAAGLVRLYDRFTGNHILQKAVFAAFAALLIGSLVWGTHIRNSKWATEKSLWEDAMEKAPGNARPLLVLAWDIAYGANENPDKYDEALDLYTRALPLRKPLKMPPAFIYNNMAGIYAKKKDYERAIKYYEKALTIEPGNTLARFNLVNVLIHIGQLDVAENHIDRLLSINKDADAYLKIKGLLLLKQGRSQDALVYLKKAFSVNPNNRDIRMDLAMALSLTGHHKDAGRLFKQMLDPSNPVITPIFCLIENSARAGDLQDAREYADQLLSRVGIDDIRASLVDHVEDNFQVPLQEDLILTVIAHQLSAKVD